MSILAKRSIVMELDFVTKQRAHFHTTDEDEMREREFFRPHIEVWKDMGEPKVITLTMVPGDALNEEES